MQKDVVLRIPMCNFSDIVDCDDPLSNHKVMTERNGFIEYETVDAYGSKRNKHICEVAVPGACPRIQCFNEEKGKYQTCRLLSFIQSQKNESGFWMKLPCSQCEEKRNLYSITKGFVHSEDTGGN